jgi:hypothetical protein
VILSDSEHYNYNYKLMIIMIVMAVRTMIKMLTEEEDAKLIERIV